MSSALPDLCSVRDAMTRIEGLGMRRHHRRAAGFAAHPATDASDLIPLGGGTLPLDALLGGGLKRGAVHEIVAESPRDEAAASEFASALAGLAARGSMLVWIVDDRAAWETGTPYRPGLAAHGLDPDQVVLVKTKDAATTLWASEEALRAGAPVVLTEFWRARSDDLAASRRLLLAARREGAMSLVVHAGMCRDERLSSGAETRFAVAASPSDHLASAGRQAANLGSAHFAVRLLKMRGGVESRLGIIDRDQTHHLAWDRAARRFRKPHAFDSWREAQQHENAA